MDRSDRKQLPAFASKAEEAAWWYDNREKLDEEFVAAIRSGRARFGRLEDRIAETRSIRLDAEDEARAMALAKQRGVEYRTFVKRLVHDALQRPEQKAQQEGRWR